MKVEIGRGRGLPPLHLVAMLTIAMLSMLPRGAVSAAVPDSVTPARLSTAVMEQNRLRIVDLHRQIESCTEAVKAAAVARRPGLEEPSE